MQGIIRKWGNSQGIRLNKSIMESLNLHVNDPIEIEVLNDEIIIKKSHKVTMKSLFENYTDDDYESEEMDWGSPVGKEIW